MSGAALFALALYALTIVLGWYSTREPKEWWI